MKRDQLWLIAALSFTGLVAVTPLVATDIPPLLDYHNHLARQYILHRLPESPTLLAFYQAAWPATPYLAFDAIVQGLARLMPVDTAGKAFLALMFLLMGLAPLTLNLALFRRITPIALAGLLFLHNGTVTLGFVNYLFGIGFGLILFALWIAGRGSTLRLRLLWFPLLCTLLFFSHLLGFVIYLLCLGSYELGQHLSQARQAGGARLWHLEREQRLNLLSLLLQIVPPLTIFAVFGPSTHTVTSNTYGGIERKFELLLGMFEYLIPPYLWTLDRVLAIALPLGLIAALALRIVRVPAAMYWPLGAMLLLFFVMPRQLFSGWGADHRLLPALGLLLIGSLGPGPAWGKGTTRVLTALFIGLVLLRAATVALDWRRANDYYAEYRQAFAHIAQGSKVYFAFGHNGSKTFRPYPIYHLPQLVLAQRDVYVPYLFASLPGGGFTLRYQPAVEPLQRLSPGPVLLRGESPAWEALLPRFDYFLLVNERHFRTPVPTDKLEQIYSGTRVRLYRNPNIETSH